MSRPYYIFAGGGSGGHLYPGLAVAEELVKIDADAAIVFACSDRPIDRAILESSPYAFCPQPVRPLPSSLRRAPGFVWAWLGAKALAGELIGDLRPKAVLGLGGFAAGPLLARAGGAVRSALLNPDAVPGKANRYLAGKVDAIFTQFESTTARFPARLAGAIHTVGCPIRRRVVSGDRGRAARLFGLSPERRTVLVLGGSGGAASINAAMAGLAEELDQRCPAWQVLHVTGRSGTIRATDAYRPRRFAARVLDYCDRMDLAYAIADLAVCRGGASTIAELAGTATPAIVIPYPYHRDMQQSHNAAEMVAAGAGIRLRDARDPAANARALAGVLLPLLADPDRVDRMARAAAGLARPNAAGVVAAWLASGLASG